MTFEEFTEVWRELIQVHYPKHYTPEQAKSAARVWMNKLGVYDVRTFHQAIVNHRDSREGSFFPILEKIASQAFKISKSNERYDPGPVSQDDGGLRKLYDAVNELREREDVPQGFNDNSFDGGYPANYQTVKSLSECMVNWFDEKFREPAMSFAIKKRESEPRVDLPATELGDKEVNGIKTKVCYYCGHRVTRKDIKSDYHCSPCNVAFTLTGD